MDKKQSLKKQQAKWYKILEDEGFEDIESTERLFKQDEKTIISRNSFHRINDKPEGKKNRNTQFETALNVHKAKEDYFYYAEHFLNEYQFDSEIEKKIWECHANGISVDETFKILAALSIRSKKQIDNTISKLIKEMKKVKGIK